MAGVRYYFYYVGYVAVKCKNELHFEFFCLKLTNSFRKPIKTDTNHCVFGMMRNACKNNMSLRYEM